MIAMQFEISDRAAKAFAEELWFCLIRPPLPDRCQPSLKHVAMLDVNQIEFATPVLFLRPGFVDLFNFKNAFSHCSTCRRRPSQGAGQRIGRRRPPASQPSGPGTARGRPTGPAVEVETLDGVTRAEGGTAGAVAA